MISQQAESFSISCFLKFLRSFFGKAAEFRAARGRGETLAGGFSCGLCTVFVAFSRKSDAKSFYIGTIIYRPTAVAWRNLSRYREMCRNYYLKKCPDDQPQHNALTKRKSHGNYVAKAAARYGFAVWHWQNGNLTEIMWQRQPRGDNARIIT